MILLRLHPYLKMKSIHRLRFLVFTLIIGFGWAGFSNTALAAGVWRKVTTPHFTILSQGSEKKVRMWARDIEFYIQAMERLYPVEPTHLEKLQFIIFEGGLDPEIDKSPLTQDASAFNSFRSSISFHLLEDRNFLIVGDLVNEKKGRLLLYREATRWYFSGADRKLPKWLLEGIAEVIGSLKVEAGQATLDETVSGGYYDFHKKLQVPLRKLMTSSNGVPYPADQVHMMNLYDEAWLLVIYFLTHEGLPGVENLKEFHARTQAGEPDEKVFNEIFHTSYEELEKKLLLFSEETKESTFQFPGKFIDRSEDFAVMPATVDDVDFGMGLLWVYTGDAGRAEKRFAQVRSRSPSDPRGYEGRAAIDTMRGDMVGMIAHYSKAVSLGSDYFMARYYVQANTAASMLGGELLADALNETTARNTIDEMERICRLRPSFYPAYDIVASLMGSVSNVTVEDAAVLKQGLERFPGRPVLEAGQAAFEMKIGRLASAKKRIDRIKAGTGEEASRAVPYARKLERRLANIVNLSWAEKYSQTGKIKQSQELLDKLKGAPLLPAEQQKYRELLEAALVESDSAKK